ncbi:hypothetical protein JCM19231_3444 [Vibrio ishigakensis]|uniref:Uncharacterized protein n=1 Tax=Vibrio ishigakensis TaxID=1481914 RepID=A0A0B8NZ43_9VIBR|nr:hypothetical protein JCM19231_3444 [Vibrio ishigakensis]
MKYLRTLLFSFLAMCIPQYALAFESHSEQLVAIDSPFSYFSFGYILCFLPFGDI